MFKSIKMQKVDTQLAFYYAKQARIGMETTFFFPL